MERLAIPPRPGWQQRCEAVGFSFHSVDGRYWDESACYRFTAAEIDQLELATSELHDLCLATVDEVIRRNLFRELLIPEPWIPRIIDSWEQDEHSLYGRFDFRYDGHSPPRLLEYNADTPTMLLESSVVQWFWLQDCHPEADQFNSLHEKLIERWRFLWGRLPPGTPLHLSCTTDSEEDFANTAYLRDTALQAGLDARFLPVEEIGWDRGAACFVDEQGAPIRALFKLYPWEWMVQEAFGPHLLQQQTMRVLEPPWKMVLSNKAILPLLWRLYPGHANLLPAWRQPPGGSEPFLRKPIFSREGADITLFQGEGTTRHSESRGYGAEGYIYQHYLPLPRFDNRYAVVGSWIIGDDPAGIGIREDDTPITQSTSRFIPHYFQ